MIQQLKFVIFLVKNLILNFQNQNQHLSKNNVLDVEFNAGVNLLDDEIIDVLQNTLDSLFKQKGIDLRNNEKLLVSLGLHLTPALDRLLDDSQIENPLTAKIKERHPKEFAMAEILNDAIESIYHKRFTEDEVAYFALHFIVSARQKQKFTLNFYFFINIYL